MDTTYELWLSITCLLLILVGWFALLWAWFKPRPPEDLVARRHREISRRGFKSRMGAR